MTTIVISGSNLNRNVREIKCSVSCKWIGVRSIITNVYILQNPSLKLTISMEGSWYYPSLDIKKNKNYLSTTSFLSEVPVPYFSFADYNIQSPEVPFASVKKYALFLASNCASKSNRENLVKYLMNRVPVKSLGKCLRNSQDSSGSYNSKSLIMKQYALYFSFENQLVDDYVTEKLWGALSSGTIPVYKGAPNIKDHVPENSIVSVDLFSSLDELANHLNEILKNETLYYEYHKWRKQPLPKWFMNKYNFTNVHSECRTCIWASEKMAFNKSLYPTSSYSNLKNYKYNVSSNVTYVSSNITNVFGKSIILPLFPLFLVFYFSLNKCNKKKKRNDLGTEKIF